MKEESKEHQLYCYLNKVILAEMAGRGDTPESADVTNYSQSKSIIVFAQKLFGVRIKEYQEE